SLEEYKFTLEKGDVLLLYTDGVTEAMNPYLEEYGIDRLKSVFANSADLSAEEIVAKIRFSVLEFTAGSPLSDDLTILVLKGIDDSGT
ncbi:MAG: serine/threonine-protein phosphatase, partial [Acidobacteria bacterium]|nr:serine/threonine-protein phosphatase [Acidobacteriota bacterium]